MIGAQPEGYRMVVRIPAPRAEELEALARQAGFTPEEITGTCMWIIERDAAFDEPVRKRLRALIDGFGRELGNDAISTPAKW